MHYRLKRILLGWASGGILVFAPVSTRYVNTQAVKPAATPSSTHILQETKKFQNESHQMQGIIQELQKQANSAVAENAHSGQQLHTLQAEATTLQKQSRHNG